MSHFVEQEPLTKFTERMNDILPNYDIAGDPQPSAETRLNLLHDIRATRDVYAENRNRVENQLLAVQQIANALSSQLRIADEKLTSLEDLIGEMRVRMEKRGIATHYVVKRQHFEHVTSVAVDVNRVGGSLLPAELSGDVRD